MTAAHPPIELGTARIAEAGDLRQRRFTFRMMHRQCREALAQRHDASMDGDLRALRSLRLLFANGMPSSNAWPSAAALPHFSRFDPADGSEAVASSLASL